MLIHCDHIAHGSGGNAKLAMNKCPHPSILDGSAVLCRYANAQQLYEMESVDPRGNPECDIGLRLA